MTKLQNTWLALLALVALLALASVSCGPGGGTGPPTVGDTAVRIIVDGAGRVIAGPTSHECRDDCLWMGDGGFDTSIEAVPAPSFVFVAWEGACDAFENPCTRTFEDGDTIKATFAPHALRLDLSGDGEGTFHIQGAGIDATCDGDCGVGLDAPGLQLAVTAVPKSARTTIDEAWSGPCDPTDAQRAYCLVEVTGLTTVGKTWRHPPVALDDTYGTARNATLSVSAVQGVLANDDDTPDDVLTASLVAGAERGSVTLVPDGGFTYTPDGGFTGKDTFTYVASDGELESEPATVTLTVEEDDD